MSHTRTFTREQLDAWGLPDDLPTEGHAAKFPEAPVELHREQVETRRWVAVQELVFRAPDDGKAYRVRFEEGLTEVQEDTDPWNYARTVDAVEVEQRPRTVMEWQPVGEQPATAPVAPVDRAAVLREAERRAIRYVLLAEAADFLRDCHFRDGMTVQEIGTAMRHWADRERRLADEAQQACGAWGGCSLPASHMGHADIPENHSPGKAQQTGDGR